mmetsp:Transcript_8180/g.17661  ORF Transcript_8180/g.17661 Transcript_8180/m.17661 type:complete len:231 (-) Transcript_8180:658-1350(-)
MIFAIVDSCNHRKPSFSCNIPYAYLQYGMQHILYNKEGKGIHTLHYIYQNRSMYNAFPFPKSLLGLFTIHDMTDDNNFWISPDLHFKFLLLACRLLSFFQLGLLLFFETFQFFSFGHGGPGIIFGALLMIHPLLLLIQGCLLINPEGEIDFSQDHSDMGKFVMHDTMSPSTHRFDASQHHRSRGKAFRDFQLRNLKTVPNVPQIAGAFEYFGYQVGIFLVTEFQLCQGFF